MDREAPVGDVYYRLRQTDVDGMSTVSDIVHVLLTAKEANEVLVFPNPSEGIFTVHVQQAITAAAQCTLLDPTGRTVREHTLPPGTSDIPFDLTSVPAGIYRLQIQRGERLDVVPVVRW